MPCDYEDISDLTNCHHSSNRDASLQLNAFTSEAHSTTGTNMILTVTPKGAGEDLLPHLIVFKKPTMQGLG